MKQASMPDVGQRIRALRESRGLSLRALAERCELSINAIARIERGENSPTVATLHQLASGLGVPITSFFESSSDQTIVFVRRNNRLGSKREGFQLESLGSGLRRQQIEPFLVTLDAGSSSGEEPITHGGHEFVFCVHGSVIYEIDGTDYVLESGDSLIFEASLPHRFYNPTDSTASILLIFQTSLGSASPGQQHPHV